MSDQKASSAHDPVAPGEHGLSSPRDVACPTCGVGPKDPCVGLSGHAVFGGHHSERRVVWRGAGEFYGAGLDPERFVWQYRHCGNSWTRLGSAAPESARCPWCFGLVECELPAEQLELL